jgi:hypothetical protein
MAADAGPAGTSPTLAAVVGGLGTIVTVAAAPAGLNTPVSRPVIHDLIAPPAMEQGDILLAVGVAASSHAAIDLVGAAAKSGAAAIVFMSSEQLPRQLIEAASDPQAPVALLTIEPTLTWSQLHTLLRTTTVAAGQPIDEGRRDTGDLFGLANAIAAMVGGPATIEDRESTVLAYSSHDTVVDEHRRQTILGHRVPEAWRKRLQDDGVFRRLWNERGVVRIEYPDAEPPLHPRIAIAVRAGDEILGSIWVAEGERPLGAAAEAALVDAAPVAALHLIRWRASEDLDRARRSALLRSVLEGTTAADVVAPALDVDADAHITVLAFKLLLDSPEDVALRTSRACDLIVLYCESFRRKAVSVAIADVVYVLVPDTQQPDRSRLVALATDIVERIRGPLHTEVIAGVGSSDQGVSHVASSRREADQVLRVVREPGAVGTIEAHRPATIIDSLRDAARANPSLLEGALAQLRANDVQHKTAYVDTLRAYLDSFGDVAAASAIVGVHQNTFRYRLRRLSEIADFNLDDPLQRLVVHLQLHLD